MVERCPTAEELARRRLLLRRSAWTLVALLAIGALAWKAVTASGGVPDPTAPGVRLGHGAVVVDSALLVFREGLEAVLVLAAFTASFVGANRGLRRPVAGGAALALVASVATWFVAIGVIGALGGPGPRRPGRHRAARGRRPARGDELVLPQDLLDRLDLGAQPQAAESPRRRRGRPAGAARARAARLHRGLPRGLRGRALPPEPPHPGGIGDGARGRRDRLRADARRRCGDVRRPSTGCRTSGCSSRRACCSASCCS